MLSLTATIRCCCCSHEDCSLSSLVPTPSIKSCTPSSGDSLKARGHLSFSVYDIFSAFYEGPNIEQTTASRSVSSRWERAGKPPLSQHCTEESPGLRDGWTAAAATGVNNERGKQKVLPGVASAPTMLPARRSGSRQNALRAE